MTPLIGSQSGLKNNKSPLHSLPVKFYKHKSCVCVSVCVYECWNTLQTSDSFIVIHRLFIASVWLKNKASAQSYT